MAEPSMDTLTDRARDVAERLKSGESPSAIAKALGMGVNGVYQHRRRLQEKGFKFPKSGGRSKGKRGRPATKPAAAKVVTNGNLVHLLGETKKDLGSRIEEVVGAKEANKAERERLLAEVQERTERMDALKDEGDSLETTQGVLETAKEAIPA